MPRSEAASSSQVALVSDSSPSTPTRSTLHQQILTEEAYCSTLSDLIRRDFFPHLERLEAENAYLDALTQADEAGGEERLEKAVRRLVNHEVRAGIVPPTPRRGDTAKRRRVEETPSSTPGSVYFDDTPRVGSRGRGEWDPTPLPYRESAKAGTTPLVGEDDEMDSGPPIEGLTLSSFQARYTSEDNASFLDILEGNEKKRKELYKWAYEAEEKANEKRRKSLLISQLQAKAGFQSSLENAPSEVKRRLGSASVRKMITAKGDVGQESQSQDREEQLPLIGMAETSPAEDEARSLQTWPTRARNALFYGPDANRSTVSQRTSSLPLYKKSGIRGPTSIFDDDSTQDRAPGINFNNTRLPDDEDEGEAGSRGSETPRSSRIDAAIGGWADTLSTAGSSIDIDEKNTLERPSSPRVAGYKFVSPLPSPKPGDLGEERVRQLMTWGTVIGTPRAVRQVGGAEGQEDQYDGSFRIPPTPNRDILARKLADKSGGGGHRNRSSASTSTAVDSRNSSKRSSRIDLSPAAQSLLNRTSRGSTGLSSLRNSLVTNRGRREESASRLRRERWTPSPSPGR